MRGLARSLALAILLAACGGASSTSAPQTPTSGSGDGSAGSATQTPTTDEDPGAPLSEAECDQLADHLIDVSFAERRAKPAPAGEQYTAEDAEAAKRELRQSLRPACSAVPRQDFTCALAAKSTADLARCQN